MTTSKDSAAFAEPVVIRCPACGASEEADPGVLAEAPMIVCRECGETWPAEPPRVPRRALAALSPPAPAPAAPGGGMLEAERRPLIGYSSGADTAWAAKVAGDLAPEPPRRSRLPINAAAFAALLFLAAFFGGREGAVAALPDLAGLYAALGLPVILDDLALEDVSAERIPAAAGARLVVRGAIRNSRTGSAAATPLLAVLLDGSGAVVATQAFDPPARAIAPGKAEPFVLELAESPPEAAEIVLRFAPADP